MPEISELSVRTNTSVNGDAIEIFTFYREPVLPDIINTFISNDSGNYLGTGYIEGECVIEFVQGGDSNISFFLDVDGTFVINSTDASKYSLDSLTGNLLYTE